MSKIIQLSEDIVNKIAAGEVIERPASVVKELLENALDAGATVISVDIKKAGKELIKVKDNGCGMSKEDAQLCIARHATSKIRTAEDLHHIQTLGFRGEALSSIAAVSHFILMTKEKESLSGTKIVVSGGVLQKNEAVGSADGTTIEMHDLFLNTPVRKKFMKSDSTELKSIIDIVMRYALMYPKAAFTVVSDGKAVLETESADLLSVIASLYGNAIVKELLPVSKEGTSIRITGYVSKPTYTRGDKEHQSIFVNGRYVKDHVITHALHEAYHSVLFVHRHPFAVLHVEVDPAIIDVNVHPTKREVKFEKSDVIYRAVYHAVRDVLEKEELIPDAEMRQGTLSRLASYQTMPKYAFEQSMQTMLSSQAALETHDTLNAVYIEGSKFPPMKILGQIHKTFFVAETPGGMLVIDQHIVQERVLYERFMMQYLDSAVKTQALLQAEVIEFAPHDAIVVGEHIGDFEKLGFLIEEFGKNSFLLRAIPMIFGRAQPKELMPDLIGQFDSGKRTAVEEKAEGIITRMSCRYSVKAGDTFTVQQMESWLKELDTCTLPYHCPHGRPIFVRITADELEKMFLRK